MISNRVKKLNPYVPVSNAYFLKATINRMCEHAPDETLEESQRAEILKVDSIILEAEKQVPVIRDETQKSFEVGLIQFTDFIPTQVHLNNIQELVEKYKTLPWNSTITGEKKANRGGIIKVYGIFQSRQPHLLFWPQAPRSCRLFLPLSARKQRGWDMLSFAADSRPRVRNFGRRNGRPRAQGADRKRTDREAPSA